MANLSQLHLLRYWYNVMKIDVATPKRWLSEEPRIKQYMSKYGADANIDLLFRFISANHMARGTCPIFFFHWIYVWPGGSTTNWLVFTKVYIVWWSLVLLQSIEDPGISNPILFSRWLVCKKLCLFSTPTWRQNHSIWPPTTWFFFEMGSFRYTVAIYILESKNVCWKTHLTKKTGVVTTSLVGSQRIFAGAGGGFFFDKRLKVVRCPFWTHINWNNSRSFRCEMGLRQLSLDHVPYISDHTVWICLDILV